MSNNDFFAIDVGNTDIVIAFIKNFKISETKRYKTSEVKIKNIFLFKGFKKLKQILSIKKKVKCVISSVVPEINLKIKKDCTAFLKSQPHFVSYNKTNLGINIKLKSKKQVGADRLVNTVAVKKIYKFPAIVIDFGTTTTFDVINNKGDYIGGLITPGINLSLYNLYKKTSKLPLVKFKKIKNVVGTNTKNAIENGLYWGYVGLVSFIINKIEKSFKKKFFCIATGGLAKIISKDIKHINVINENLTLLGLIEIYKKL